MAASNSVRASALAVAHGPGSPVCVVHRASWPDERTLWTDPSRLAADLKREGIKGQALIIAGPAIAELAPGGSGELRQGHRSRLYDPDFDHGCRSAEGKPD